MGLQLPKRMRRVGTWALLVPAVLSLGACSSEDKDQWKRLGMPEGASDRSGFIENLWVGAWIAALLTGVLVWGLIIYAIIKFRRRSDDEIPVQTRYNLPIEILYTVAPVVMVLVFFFFTVDTQNNVQEEVKNPDHVVNVVGSQWAWTFNYHEDEALDGKSVYQPGTTAVPTTLYLPVGETVKFNLSSPDVIHSFWVPAFSYKLDVFPGRTNSFTMTPTEAGTYVGRCAELCGVYHSRMLFNVKVVSHAEFAKQLALLEERGFVGEAMGGIDADTTAGLDEENGAGE